MSWTGVSRGQSMVTCQPFQYLYPSRATVLPCLSSSCHLRPTASYLSLRSHEAEGTHSRVREVR